MESAHCNEYALVMLPFEEALKGCASNPNPHPYRSAASCFALCQDRACFQQPLTIERVPPSFNLGGTQAYAICVPTTVQQSVRFGWISGSSFSSKTSHHRKGSPFFNLGEPIRVAYVRSAEKRTLLVIRIGLTFGYPSPYLF